MRQKLVLLAYLFSGMVVLVGSSSLVRCTVAQGTDFFVFWHAAQAVTHGEPLYSVARDGGMVFKYPPWLLPFFLPLGLLPLEISKWIWGLLEVGSLAYVVRWLWSKTGVSPKTCLIALIFFWGLWIVHALDGQFSLQMLALALAGESLCIGLNLSSFSLVAALSAKIFTVFPLIGLKWTRQSLKSLLVIASALIALSVPALVTQPDQSPVSLLRDWKDAATSAGKFLSWSQVRGRFNPGLPGYSLRLLNVPAEQSSADVIAALVFSLVLGASWALLSQRLHQRQRWLGWLALVPVVHPLPWWHLFVFSFPLATYVLDRAFNQKRRAPQLLAVLGLLLITVSTEKVWGKFGIFLEMNAAKSWGVLLCLGPLLILTREQQSFEPLGVALNP